MPYSRELETALRAARMAALLCEQVRREMVAEAQADAMQKQDKSPVTVADYGSQAVICRVVGDAFPRDPIVAEEDAAALRGVAALAPRIEQVAGFVRHQLSDASAAGVLEWIDRGNGAAGPRFWTLDPIDGTKGFLRKDQYAVALALIEDGEVKVGVLACPALETAGGARGALFAAVRGQGALAFASTGAGEAMRIQVALPGSAGGERLVESVESGHGDHDLQETVARRAGLGAAPVRMDSQAKYAAVARGDAALYLRLPSPRTPDYREKIWDHAAGMIVVEEAGGRVTDIHGVPLRFGLGETLRENQGVVVTNGAVHDAVLAAVRDVRGAGGAT